MRRTGIRAVGLLVLLILLAGCASPVTPTAQPEPTFIETIVETAPVIPLTLEAATRTPSPAPSTQASEPTTEAPPQSCQLTPADQEGPYYKAGAPIKDGSNRIAPDNLPGDRLALSGTVYAAGCQAPLAGAVVEIWHADINGQYDFSDQFILRGGIRTGPDGKFVFETILPALYEGRPRHIHLKASHADSQTLTTQIYFADDARSAGMPPELIVETAQDGRALKAVFNIILAGK